MSAVMFPPQRRRTLTAAPSVEPFGNLFSALEDLLRRIADTDDPDIRRKRAHVRRELIELQSQMPIMVRPIGAAEPEPNWEQSAIAALAGVAFALSVFQED